MPRGLILASSSPRRQELLQRLVADFRIASSAVEEVGSSLLPGWEIDPLDLPAPYGISFESHPLLWAWRKAVDVLQSMDRREPALVLAADTMVLGEGRILGKPGNAETARITLDILRGRKHYVATGCVLLDSDADDPTPLWSCSVISTVWMRNYSGNEIEEYLATGEPLDKAGAYAVQGLGGKLVDRVEGCYFNIVGLPLCHVRRGLGDAGVLLKAYPENDYCDYCPLQSPRG